MSNNTITSITLITTTWNFSKFCSVIETPLYKSFKKNNPDLNFLHFHFCRNEYLDLENKFKERFLSEHSCFLLYKIQLLRDKLLTTNTTDFIVFADAFDVVCTGDIKSLPNLFDLEKFVILGQERGESPPLYVKQNWPFYTDFNEWERFSHTFLNSGVILAKKEKYIEMLNNMLNNILTLNIHFNNDQDVYTYYYCNKLFEPEIKLDYSNIFVLNTYLRTTADCYINNNNNLILKETGVRPMFIHDNGSNYGTGSPKYISTFNLN